MLLQETQTIELKESWKDDHLKTISAFLNTDGGALYIGVDDKGNAVGAKNIKKQLEDLPNKIMSFFNIPASVEVKKYQRKEIIKITVPCSPAHAYQGKFYHRAGTTTQELKGAALQRLLLEANSLNWDGMPIANVSVADLKQETFDFFKEKAIESKRLDEKIRKESNQKLLENLQLTEGGHLKRAALLLFHPNPEKYTTGAYIKIGFFSTDTDLLFQDTIHGNLIEQLEKTMELLLTKYSKALISYKGLSRKETYEYPEDALREALLNAVAHKDYTTGVPIQIRVYADKIMIWNEGQLPSNWTKENFMETHFSRPHNPSIANAFFRCGYVESWGRGIGKMTEFCLAAGLPKPQFKPNTSEFLVVFAKDIYNQSELEKLGLNGRQIKAVLYVKEKGRITNKEYQEINEVSDRTASREISEIVKTNILEQAGSFGAGSFYQITPK
jgi:ATP-dependent DNA helicase RecG